MLRTFRRYSIVAVLALFGSSVGLANRVQAQTYQIDCAILLCLSGGWPASVPCARARSEFIRRITPWPVEPPLQIWRCPMGASYDPVTPSDNRGRLYDILFTAHNRPRPLLSPATEPLLSENAVLNLAGPKPNLPPEGFALQLVQDRATTSHPATKVTRTTPIAIQALPMDPLNGPGPALSRRPRLPRGVSRLRRSANSSTT